MLYRTPILRTTQACDAISARWAVAWASKSQRWPAFNTCHSVFSLTGTNDDSQRYRLLYGSAAALQAPTMCLPAVSRMHSRRWRMKECCHMGDGGREANLSGIQERAEKQWMEERMRLGLPSLHCSIVVAPSSPPIPPREKESPNNGSRYRRAPVQAEGCPTIIGMNSRLSR